VTKSQAQALYSQDYSAAEGSTEAHWKPLCIRLKIVAKSLLNL